MPNGEITARVADSLQQEFGKKGFHITHDHRLGNIDSPDNLGKLRTWFGEKPKREMLLADLDIAIISTDDKVVALIEIEETTDKPKVILGDILAILLGSGITFKNKHDFQIREWTTLIVMSHDQRQSHQARNEFLSNQLNSLKSNLNTPNAKIERIMVDSFADEKQLEEKLRQHVTKAIAHYEIGISSASKI